MGGAGRETRRPGGRGSDAEASRRLAQRLGRLVGDAVCVELTTDGRTLVAFERGDGPIAVRLHRHFLEADERTVARLASFIDAPDGPASGWLDAYLADHRLLVGRRVRRSTPSPSAEGRSHDLGKLLDHTREEYRLLFREELCGGVIAWSIPPSVRLPRKSIKLGSYSPDSEIIRVHPALDQGFVPAFFLRWIIFHELLHHRLRDELRTRVGPPHPPHFRRLERRYPMHELAGAWERRHLDRLLAWGGR